MPVFSWRSQSKLRTCDERLQRVFNEVVKRFDCAIIDGHREQAAQEEAYAKGHSKLKWPFSKHNKKPSEAVDAVPYPIDWRDRDRFIYFAGYVMRAAHAMGVELVWGGDWDGDWQTRDNKFDDLAHFQLAPED